MFEFGRDLRKLFEKARESDDLGWLELIGADLIEAEALQGLAADIQMAFVRGIEGPAQQPDAAPPAVPERRDITAGIFTTGFGRHRAPYI